MKNRQVFVRALVAQHSWLPAQVRAMNLTDFVTALVATEDHNRALAAALKGES